MVSSPIDAGRGGKPDDRGRAPRTLLKAGAVMATAPEGDAQAAGPVRKIALEEHFTTPELERRYVARPTRSDALFADIERRLADFGSLRLETMDQAGIDLCVLSVTTPGVQAETDTAAAIRLARQANDRLAAEVARQPKRYAGFAHLPMQNPAEAADELERCVRDLRFKGALINGQTGDRRHREPCAAAGVRRHLQALSQRAGDPGPHGRDPALPALALRQPLAVLAGRDAGDG